jgi:hypothetical protein
MKPTKSMDIRVQVILDSRVLATIIQYFDEHDIPITSVSDLVRKSLQTLASQANKSGIPYITSRDKAHKIVSSISQRGQGFDTHPFYISSTDVPTPPTSNQDKVDRLMSLSPNLSRDRALEIVQAYQSLNGRSK